VTPCVFWATSSIDGSFSYLYSRKGQRRQMTTRRRVVNYVYGSGGVLSRVDVGGVGSVTLRVDALGRQDSVAYPNGTWSRFRFDPDGRILDIDVQRSGAKTLDMEYAYDAAGRPTSLWQRLSARYPTPAQTTCMCVSWEVARRFHDFDRLVSCPRNSLS
jgi:hypothetical protein